jgi:hypothetical protein
LSCGVGRPPLSAVVRDPPVECGPDVAPRSRAWKARPVPSSRPDATPMAQVSSHLRWTAVDRDGPRVAGATGTRGHGRRGPTALQRGGYSHELNRRVRPVQMTTCLVGKLRMQRGRRACDAGLRIRCRSGLRRGL